MEKQTTMGIKFLDTVCIPLACGCHAIACETTLNCLRWRYLFQKKKKNTHKMFSPMN